MSLTNFRTCAGCKVAAVCTSDGAFNLRISVMFYVKLAEVASIASLHVTCGSPLSTMQLYQLKLPSSGSGFADPCTVGVLVTNCVPAQ